MRWLYLMSWLLKRTYRWLKLLYARIEGGDLANEFKGTMPYGKGH